MMRPTAFACYMLGNGDASHVDASRVLAHY